MRRPASVVVAALISFHAAAEPIELNSSRVAFSEEEIQEPAVVGRLEFRGGIHVTSPDGRFGGWSGLLATERGGALIAVSDKGYWLVARPRYDARGQLVDLSETGEIGVLPDMVGRPVRGMRRDAEDLALLPDGVAVAFEGDHRIWRYPFGPGPFASSPVPLAPPPGLFRAPSNRGIEAMTALADGRLLAITEGLFVADGELQGWLSDGPPHRAWQALTWLNEGLFVPTGAAALPGGDVLVLQRRFSWIGGLASRISLVRASELRPGARLAGREVAVLQTPLVHENFEAIAVTERAGETLVYLLSDDNYQPVPQRSLLLMFALRQ